MQKLIGKFSMICIALGLGIILLTSPSSVMASSTDEPNVSQTQDGVAAVDLNQPKSPTAETVMTKIEALPDGGTLPISNQTILKILTENGIYVNDFLSPAEVSQLLREGLMRTGKTKVVSLGGNKYDIYVNTAIVKAIMYGGRILSAPLQMLIPAWSIDYDSWMTYADLFNPRTGSIVRGHVAIWGDPESAAAVKFIITGIRNQ